MDIDGEMRRALRSKIFGDSRREATSAIATYAAYLRTAAAEDPMRHELEADLLSALDCPSWRIRKAAVEALSYASRQVLQNALHRASTDDHHYVRAAAEHGRSTAEIARSVSIFRPHDEQDLMHQLIALEAKHGLHARRQTTRFAEQYAGKLLKHAHHELARVLNSASLRVERMMDEGSCAESLETLHGRLIDLSRMLNGLRDLTAPEAPRVERIDLRGLVETAFLVVVDSGASNAHLIIVAESEVEVLADRLRLQQALENILRNAIEAYQDQSERPVQVTISQRSKFATIDVRDEGCGMQMSQRLAAGVLFHSTKTSGCGVGLALAKLVVERQHDGVLSIQTAVGEGTTVRMVLPMRIEDAGE